MTAANAGPALLVLVGAALVAVVGRLAWLAAQDERTAPQTFIRTTCCAREVDPSRAIFLAGDDGVAPMWLCRGDTGCQARAADQVVIEAREKFRGAR